ncbi:MAG TPA: HepT-like ribonuclease domain-containing protein [Bradyrhizobium sp.]|uniref:HepT-like ribonuclease domain-containing protein n=1 Tax=Bradyrhizobium sp. TaxID=376 RepID=UPI002CF438F8|nr:HepT-like ribonuclease domain-containing protein [Bradyrhizobium sp.]HLZ02962.1 HepT-like ribonuclease domain-containing protein [Bradyrhizobium sp.]
MSDIISWGERLQAHLAGIDRDAFFANPLVQDAVSKCVEAIGEAAGKLDDINPELDRTVPDLNLKLARRIRDRLSHGYYRIDLVLL